MVDKQSWRSLSFFRSQHGVIFLIAKRVALAIRWASQFAAEP